MWDEKRWQHYQETKAAEETAKEARKQADKQRRARIDAIRATQLSFFDAPLVAPTNSDSQEASPAEVSHWLTGFEEKES